MSAESLGVAGAGIEGGGGAVGGVSDPFVGDKGKLALQLSTGAPKVSALSPGGAGLLLATLLGLGVSAISLRRRSRGAGRRV